MVIKDLPSFNSQSSNISDCIDKFEQAATGLDPLKSLPRYLDESTKDWLKCKKLEKLTITFKEVSQAFKAELPFVVGSSRLEEASNMQPEERPNEYFNRKLKRLLSYNKDISVPDIEAEIRAGLPSEMRLLVPPANDIPMLRKNVVHGYRAYISNSQPRTVYTMKATELTAPPPPFEIDAEACLAKKMNTLEERLDQLDTNQKEFMAMSGERFDRGGGRGRGRFQAGRPLKKRFNNNRGGRSNSEMECYLCKKKGHSFRNCFQLKERLNLGSFNYIVAFHWQVKLQGNNMISLCEQTAFELR